MQLAVGSLPSGFGFRAFGDFGIADSLGFLTPGDFGITDGFGFQATLSLHFAHLPDGFGLGPGDFGLSFLVAKQGVDFRFVVFPHKVGEYHFSYSEGQGAQGAVEGDGVPDDDVGSAEPAVRVAGADGFPGFERHRRSGGDDIAGEYGGVDAGRGAALTGLLAAVAKGWHSLIIPLIPAGRIAGNIRSGGVSDWAV